MKVHSQFKIEKMDTMELEGKWNEKKARLKQKFAVLTDNDLMFEEGKKEEFYAKLQVRLGKTREDILKLIAAL